MKRNQILITDEARPVLRTNFDSKQNKVTNAFFGKRTLEYRYPNENYPFVLVPHEKKLVSMHGRSSSRFKDKL